MAGDPITALQSLGYTEREAAFLYLVGVHSGYFLRRQFDYFTDRNKGALVVRFLEKARRAGHIESLDYRQGWQVYHLFSRSVYRLLGNVNSQLRRRKGDAQVRARLMALDYILENEGDRFLESAEERLGFFADVRGISPELFTGDDGSLCSLLAAFPISLANRMQPTTSPVRCAFIDEGLATTEKFFRFLAVADPLLRAIGSFELIYIATSDFNFADAKSAFWSHFSSASLRSPRLFEDDAGTSAPQPRVSLRPQFTTLLLEYSYPRIQRSEPRGSMEGSHAAK